MKTVVKIEKQTNNKYLNSYKVTYNDGKKTYDYFLASRNDEKDLVINTKKAKANAVRILPYFKKDNKIFVVVIKEFRHPLNMYIYGLPAGLVDDNEDYELAAKRELEEETGFVVKQLTLVHGPAFTSAGMTDECTVCFNAEVEEGGKTSLGDIEDIKVKIIELKDILQFLKDEDFAAQSSLQLRSFYYENINNI